MTLPVRISYTQHIVFLKVGSSPVGVFGHRMEDDTHPRRTFILELIRCVEVLASSACSIGLVLNGH